jgi:hypothetical protein
MAMLFACGSMVLTYLLGPFLPRYARKNRTHLKMKYRSAEGSEHQLRKS